MTSIKNTVSYTIIPKDMFQICRLDGMTLDEICRNYTAKQLGKKVAYALDKFAYHIQKQHGIDIKNYIIKYLGVQWPQCPVSGGDLGFTLRGMGVRISKFKQGAVDREFLPALDAAYRRFSEERKGEGNPMYGKEGWNKGLTKETDERVRIKGERSRGFRATEETKEKQRKKRSEHPLKARHTTPHSAETREKLRENAARLWAAGAFNRITSIHLKMKEFLQTLDLKEPFCEEFQVKYFSMDFAFPQKKIAIECQGSYYHIDPRLYPDGPKDAIQRRNFGRDKAKRKVCCDQNGWIIIEAWETEINDGTFKQIVQCRLKELGLLNG